MKRHLLFSAIALLFVALWAPAGQAQSSCNQLSRGAVPSYQVGLICTFTSTSLPVSFSVQGITYWRVIALPVGTVSACSLSLDSSPDGITFTVGGILSSATIGACTSAGMYVATTATTPTLFGRLNPSITGSGSVTVVLLGYASKPKV